MQQRHACPRGHRWEADRDATAPVLCPVCGEAAQDSPADALTVPAADVPPRATTVPATIGPYEVIEEIGRGGMGVVFKARDRDLDRIVALKMILSGEYAGEEARRRFQSEAVTVASLHHPSVVAIHQVARAPDGTPYFVMEFCAGGTLAAKAGKPWPARDVATLVETLARAVAAAHEKNIVHRDLKPANILLDERGTPKITDFGLARRLSDARQTASGAILGTPAYMAPEQAGGKPAEVGPAADVWALGVILYELLAGQVPFRAASATDTLMRVLSDEPPPIRKQAPGVPRDLETITLKCLRKEPAKRY